MLDWCAKCGSLKGVFHARANKFLCVRCIEKYEDEHPDELTKH